MRLYNGGISRTGYRYDSAGGTIKVLAWLDMRWEVPASIRGYKQAVFVVRVTPPNCALFILTLDVSERYMAREEDTDDTPIWFAVLPMWLQVPLVVAMVFLFVAMNLVMFACLIASIGMLGALVVAALPHVTLLGAIAGLTILILSLICYYLAGALEKEKRRHV